jgi:probable HAF family extracellular repeat protein
VLHDITDAVGQVGTDAVLNDQGDVLNGRTAVLFGNGASQPPASCGALGLNNRSHVLCTMAGQTVPHLSSFAVWDGHALIPLAAADTFGTSTFYAWTLNDADAVVGTFTFQPAFGNPACPTSSGCDVIWSNGQPTFVPRLSGFGFTHMAGRFMLAQSAIGCPRDGNSRPIKLYDATTGAVRELDSCPSYVYDMNEQGWTVGARSSGWGIDVPREAVLYRTEGVTVMGKGEASGINDAGVVVGTVDQKAFMWKDGAMSFLTYAANDTSWTVTQAVKINNRGQILALADDSVHAALGRSVILTPAAP